MSSKDNENNAVKNFSKDAHEFIQSLDIYEDICKRLINYYITCTDTSNIFNVVSILPENILRFISFILKANDEILNKFFSKSNLTEDEVNIILSFRKKYKNLLKPIMLQISNLDKGLKNVITGISIIRKFNQELNIPTLELEILSFNKPILHTETPLSELYFFSYALQKAIRDSLKFLLKDELKINNSFIKVMKEINKDTKSISNEILNLLEKLDKIKNVDKNSE